MLLFHHLLSLSEGRINALEHFDDLAQCYVSVHEVVLQEVELAAIHLRLDEELDHVAVILVLYHIRAIVVVNASLYSIGMHSYLATYCVDGSLLDAAVRCYSKTHICYLRSHSCTEEAQFHSYD